MIEQNNEETALLIDKHYSVRLVRHPVDVNRLLNEVMMFIKPDLNNSICYSITTDDESQNDLEYQFRKYQGFLKPPVPGKTYLPTGDLDTEIIYWPQSTQGSYIKELSKKFDLLLGLKNPRVRASVVHGTDEINGIGFHQDQIAPHRVHIALQTTKETLWKFLNKNKTTTLLHQPADGIPVLLEVGETIHDIYVPKNTTRIHLWFQYHQHVSNDIWKQLVAEEATSPNN